MVISRDKLPGSLKDKVKSKVKERVSSAKAKASEKVEEAKAKVKDCVDDIKEQARTVAPTPDYARRPPEDPMKNRPKKEDAVEAKDYSKSE